MTKHPKFRLCRLRAIGWRHWDPIGLGELRRKQEGYPAPDEYDSYLIQAAGMVRSQRYDAAAGYLVSIEREHLQIASASALDRARATIAALRADNQLWNEDD